MPSLGELVPLVVVVVLSDIAGGKHHTHTEPLFGGRKKSNESVTGS